jgi:hypothetical protein
VDPIRTRPGRSAALIGAAAAIVGAAEILNSNRATLNPGSSAFVAVLWLACGAALGAGVARPFRRRPPGTGPALAAVAAGGFFLPLLPAALFAAGVPLLLAARRRFLARTSRVDGLAIAAVTIAAATLLFATSDAGSPFASPPPAERAASPGPQAIDGVPVTITVRESGDYPDVPAVHLPLRALHSEPPGRLAALWTGRAPARTHVGTSIPRLLPGGGGISRFPQGGSRFLLAAFPRAEDDVAPFATRGTLADRAAAAGIAVLHGAPRSDDPAMHLRILEGATLDRATADSLRASDAWIDVRLAAGGGRVALTGHGVRLAPYSGSAAPMDVAPTALHLLGLPVPRSADGRVLMELLDPEGPGGRTIRYSPRNVPGTRRRRIASVNRGSLRTGSNRGSERNRSGVDSPQSSDRPRRSAAACTSPRDAAIAALM